MHTKNFFYVDIIMTTIFHFENIEIFFSKEKHYFIDVSCVFLFTIDILIPNLIFGIEKLYFRIVCKYHIFIDTSFESQKVLKLRKFYSNDKFLYYTVYITREHKNRRMGRGHVSMRGFPAPVPPPLSSRD